MQIVNWQLSKLPNRPHDRLATPTGCLPLSRLPEQFSKRLDKSGQTFHRPTKHLRHYFTLRKHRLFPDRKPSLYDSRLLGKSMFRKSSTKITYLPQSGLGQQNPINPPKAVYANSRKKQSPVPIRHLINERDEINLTTRWTGAAFVCGCKLL